MSSFSPKQTLLLLLFPLISSFPSIDRFDSSLISKINETVKAKIEAPFGRNVLAVNSASGAISSLFQGDILLSKEQIPLISTRKRRRRQAISFANRWTNNTLFYYFDNSIKDERRKDSVRKGLEHIRRATCIDFREDSAAPNRVKVYSGDGCSSFVGMIGGEQLLSLGDHCNHAGTATHEFMHALGMEHTHDRFDRDNFVLINTAAVNISFLNAFWVIDAFRMTVLVPYDYGSVMHYGADSFSRDEGGMSILAKDTNFTYTMGSGIPSFYDMEAINEFYKCRAKIECWNGGRPNPRNCSICNCPSGYGGSRCDQRPTGCGQTVAASTQWNILNISLGDNANNEFHNDYDSCTHWITAPSDKKIEVRLVGMSNALCSYGCFFNGIELKTSPNPQMTGARHCCEEFLNRIWVSDQNPMPIIHFNSFRQSQFYLSYRYIDVPCGADHPLCSSEEAFCNNPFYTRTYRRNTCPHTCNLCST